MRLVYLETSRPGLLWFKQYYADRPELDWTAALAAYRTTLSQLKANAYRGKVFDGIEGVFETKITRTAFSVLYTICDDTIFVIDLRDQRGLRSASALAAFARELRRKYRLE